jgi:hypothetical protein
MVAFGTVTKDVPVRGSQRPDKSFGFLSSTEIANAI